MMLQDVLASLDDFFPTIAQIEEPTTVQNNEGEESTSWVTVEGLDEVRCVIAPVFPRRDVEMRVADMTRIERFRYAEFQQAHPEITTEMRLVADGQTWNIVSAVTDAQRITTRLMIEQVDL